MKVTFLFKGDREGQKNAKPYLVEVTEEEHDAMRARPYPNLFTGNVIASNNPRVAATSVDTKFLNPYKEMHYYGWPVFVRVSSDRKVDTSKWISSLGVDLT